MNAPTKNLPVAYSMSDLEKMAQSMVNSQLFGLTTVSQAVTLMLVAQSEGLHPATAARDYHIIQNRPAMKADTMLARFQQSGGVVEWQDYTASKVSASFRHPQSPKPVLVEWTIEMAKSIGLAGKDNWKKYPRQMLRARVISEGVRTCYPSICTGIYTPEEVGDFSPVERDVTQSAGKLGSLHSKRQEIIAATAAQIREYMANDRAWDAHSLIETSDFDADEKIACWSLLDSAQRSTLKRIGDAERAKDAGSISEPQKRRLEARIKELGLDRESVKRHCADAYSVSHFSELAPDQYSELDSALDVMASGSKETATAASALAAEGSTSSEPSGAQTAAVLTPDEVTWLEDELKKAGKTTAQLLAAMKAAGMDVQSLAKMPAKLYARATAWVERQKAPS